MTDNASASTCLTGRHGSGLTWIAGASPCLHEGSGVLRKEQDEHPGSPHSITRDPSPCGTLLLPSPGPASPRSWEVAQEWRAL